MKRLNENTKVTMTLKQLRKLVKESYQDDVDKSIYNTWLAFINKFGAEETAKVLAYRDSAGRSGIEVEDMVAKYTEDEEGTSTEEVIYPLYEKAKSVGLSTDAAQLYFDYVFTKYDKFLYDTLGDQGYLGYACKYWVEDEVLKALEGRERVYLLVFEGADEQYKDDTLPWNDALDALKAKFDVAAEGTTKNEGYQYAVLVEKNDNAVKESSFANDTTGKVEKKRYVVKSDGSDEVADALAAELGVDKDSGIQPGPGEDYEHFKPDYVFNVKMADGETAVYIVYEDEESARNAARDDLADRFETDPCNLGAAIKYFGFARLCEYISGQSDDELDRLGDLEDELGEEEFASLVQRDVDVDYSGFAEFNIDELGPAWHLAQYDNKELELSNGMYAYRVD